MQAGRGRRHRAGLFRIHRLVALLVERLGRSSDIGWQRHLAVFAQQRLEVAVAERQQKQVAPPSRKAQPALADGQRAAVGERLVGARVGERQARFEHALDQDLDRAAVFLARPQPRPQHAAVVDDEQIAGP